MNFGLMSVKPKKHLGQHFLTDKNISRRIAEQFKNHQDCKKILEIGPGMGALTTFILENEKSEVWVMDIDKESIIYLKENFPQLRIKYLKLIF
jgi:16S rRNA (adenine1518-N6/adenine1519-N6)-dimethyltransferase